MWLFVYCAGRDLPGFATDGSGRRAHTFTDLLRYVHDVPGIQRIRFATSHPRCVWNRGMILGPAACLPLGIKPTGDLIRAIIACRYFTERLVRACSELPKMCQFFHIVGIL